MGLEDLCPWPECASVIGTFYFAGRAQALQWRGPADTSSPCQQLGPRPHSPHPTGKASEEGSQVAFLLPGPTPPGHQWAASPQCRPLLSSSWSNQVNILPLQNQAQLSQGCLPAQNGVPSPACLGLSQGSPPCPTLLHQTPEILEQLDKVQTHRPLLWVWLLQKVWLLALQTGLPGRGCDAGQRVGSARQGKSAGGLWPTAGARAGPGALSGLHLHGVALPMALTAVYFLGPHTEGGLRS